MTPAAAAPPRPSRVIAEFASASALAGAIDALAREHYHDLETYAPFDLPELDVRLGRKRSRIGWLALAGGAIGLVAGYAIQWWANVHEYPLDIGGRPVHAVPAFIPSTFEATVLGAALAVFFGLLVWLRLPRLWAPIDEVAGFDRASIDRFWIVLGGFATDVDREHAEQLLRDAGAIRTVHAEGV